MREVIDFHRRRRPRRRCGLNSPAAFISPNKFRSKPNKRMAMRRRGRVEGRLPALPVGHQGIGAAGEAGVLDRRVRQGARFAGEIYEIWRDHRLLYIGSTTRGTGRRWKEWVSNANRGDRHPLCADIRRFGVDSFDVFTLPFNYGSESEMRNTETYFIDCYQRRGEAIYNKRNAFHQSQPSKKERAFSMSSEEFKRLAGID